MEFQHPQILRTPPKNYQRNSNTSIHSFDPTVRPKLAEPILLLAAEKEQKFVSKKLECNFIDFDEGPFSSAKKLDFGDESAFMRKFNRKREEFGSYLAGEENENSNSNSLGIGTVQFGSNNQTKKYKNLLLNFML